ncbi:MAG: hypothetical protein WAN71_00405 [Mycobacterium sp.]|uniref:hypothetical protein n=1 Tax=Mycobacterium sp. TaxID=1785 RepID=UPI003BB0C009
MLSATTLPTLSQVQSLDTTYLREAADYFERTGNLWDEVFAEIHAGVSAPGGTPWQGQAGVAMHERANSDMVKVRGAAFQLHEAAGIARRGGEQLQGCKAEVLEAVQEVRAAGFDVGEDYSVTDRSQGGSIEFRAQRAAQAQGHAAFIGHRVGALAANDQEIAAQITAATKGIDNLTFTESPGVDDTITSDDKHNGVQLVDHHFKDAPNPAPDPPPGGWSNDPLMRAAQKIAYGHAGTDHMDDFPDMTRDQLADLVYGKMKRSIDNPGGLRLGVSNSDGAPVIYDPKDNVMIVRDPGGADAGTVFKPDLQRDPNFVSDKFGWNEPSFKEGQLADGPRPAPAESPRPVEGPVKPRPAVPPAPPEPAPVHPPPVRPVPVEPPALRPGPSVGGFGGGGIGLPGPALGPAHEPTE